MRNMLKGLICKCGPALCSFAVFVTSYGVQSCRGHFYQPKEPDGLSKIM